MIGVIRYMMASGRGRASAWRVRLASALRWGVRIGVLVYVAGILLWLVLRALWPDSRWWALALANTFALYLFLPLIPLLPFAWWARGRRIARLLLIPGALFLWQFGELLLPPLPTPTREGPTITVMTFNVWGYNGEPKAIASSIRRADPDIVFLQELNWWLGDELQEALEGRYPYAILPSPFRGSLAILSRHPLRAAQWIQPPGTWRGAQYAVVELAGRRIHLLNLHFISSSGILNWGSPRSGIERTYARREREARAYRALIAGLEGPIIVAGDLNTTDQTTAYRSLMRGLRDAYRVAGWGWGHTYPARPQRWGRLSIPARLLRIDYIAYSPADFDAERAYLGPWDGVSDHLPVVARLRLRAPAAYEPGRPP